MSEISMHNAWAYCTINAQKTERSVQIPNSLWQSSIHFGASLKVLRKKWFAFLKMDIRRLRYKVGGAVKT